MSAQFLVEPAVIVREKHHALVFRQLLFSDLGKDFVRRLPPREHLVERRERLPVKARVGEHSGPRRLKPLAFRLREEFPNPVLPVASVVGVVLFKLPRRLGKIAREKIRDAQPPVRRVLRGIERDHFLKIRHRRHKLAEKQMRVAPLRVGPGSARVLRHRGIAFRDLLPPLRRHLRPLLGRQRIGVRSPARADEDQRREQRQRDRFHFTNASSFTAQSALAQERTAMRVGKGSGLFHGSFGG